MQEVRFPRDLPFPLFYLPRIAGIAFAKSSMLEFYDINFYSGTVKASGFLRNIPLCGCVAGATRVLVGRLQESTAELLCSIRVQRGGSRGSPPAVPRRHTSPQPVSSQTTLPRNSLPVAASTLTLYLLNLR